MFLKKLLTVIIYLLIHCNVMGQQNQDFLLIDYNKFVIDYKQDSVIETNFSEVFIFNPKYLVFPVLEFDNLPANAIIIEHPHWLLKFTRAKKITLSGLFLYDLPDNFENLIFLEELKFSLPKDANFESIVAKLKKMKSLKKLDISSSAITDEQYDEIEKKLPDIKVVDDLKLLRQGK